MSNQEAPLKLQPLKNALEEESFESRRGRMLAGALYGLLGATAYALLSGTINALTHPGLSIFVDWSSILLTWLWLGLGLAFFGALTGWFTETVKGILVGAVSLSAAVLIANLIQSSARGAITIVMFFAMALPVAAICLPVIWALRWLAERHVRLLSETGSQRTRGIILLVIVTLAFGFVPAAFQRMSATEEKTVRLVDALIKQAEAGQATESPALPLEKLPTLNAHLGMDYSLSQSKSKISTVGYDVSIIFSDGYKVTCVLVVYGDQDPFFRGCVEGDVPSP